ncbi:Uncharacterised protein [Vibrio cholerae]|nr:Uncharacterised protein [Vibrio cholerae]
MHHALGNAFVPLPLFLTRPRHFGRHRPRLASLHPDVCQPSYPQRNHARFGF